MRLQYEGWRCGRLGIRRGSVTDSCLPCQFDSVGKGHYTLKILPLENEFLKTRVGPVLKESWRNAWPREGRVKRKKGDEESIYSLDVVTDFREGRMRTREGEMSRTYKEVYFEYTDWRRTTDEEFPGIDCVMKFIYIILTFSVPLHLRRSLVERTFGGTGVPKEFSCVGSGHKLSGVTVYKMRISEWVEGTRYTR